LYIGLFFDTIMKQDAWKRTQRDLPIEYPTQPQFLFKHPDATPKEVEDWYNNELKWWGDRQFKIIIIASIVQILTLGFMASVMFINQNLFT